ncbi:SRR1-like protein [Anabrus simplex]|uniref:SRR1-like protein n=1 Tax=Anabrus simplex TaxID=316456 RepID=UPI0035A2BAA2
MSENDFKLVKYKKRNKVIHCEKQLAAYCFQENSKTVISKDVALRRINSAKEELASSSFYFSVLGVLQQGFDLLGKSLVDEILCYGLGRFTECTSARYQLALLLLLKEHFKALVFTYDPLFSEVECVCLKALDCNLIQVNEEGKRKISAKSTTLVYLPHCPKQITNNFLWANWCEGLRNCIVIGNSFSQLIESQPMCMLENAAKYILRILAYTKEFVLQNSFKYSDIFNDLSVHVFPLRSEDLSAYLWHLKEEPQYLNEDIEFITKELLVL